jgi:hypothetical protein
MINNKTVDVQRNSLSFFEITRHCFRKSPFKTSVKKNYVVTVEDSKGVRNLNEGQIILLSKETRITCQEVVESNV